MSERNRKWRRDMERQAKKLRRQTEDVQRVEKLAEEAGSLTDYDRQANAEQRAETERLMGIYENEMTTDDEGRGRPKHAFPVGNGMTAIPNDPDRWKAEREKMGLPPATEINNWGQVVADLAGDPMVSMVEKADSVLDEADAWGFAGGEIDELRSLRDDYVQTTEAIDKYVTELRVELHGMWAQYGSRTFSFERGMWGDFMMTDTPEDLTPDEVRPPFDMVRYVFEEPKPVEIMVSWGFDTGEQAINTEMDKRGDRGNRNHLISAFVWVEGHYITSGHWRGDSLMLGGAPKFRDGVGTEQAIRDVASSMGAVMRTALNATLYLSSPRANTREVPIEERVAALRARLKEAKRKSLGTHYRRKLKKQIADLQADNRPIVVVKYPVRAPTVAEGTGRKLTTRFRVRGHWRRQACGRRRQQRKLIWIEPHWKGPDVATVLERDYRVDRER